MLQHIIIFCNYYINKKEEYNNTNNTMFIVTIMIHLFFIIKVN